MTGEVGLKACASIMLGNPGEDEKTVEETIQLLKEIKPDNKPLASITWVFPNTPSYELFKERGLGLV